MDIKSQIINLFPKETDIPKEYTLPFPVVQREYLINGEIRYWQGEQQEVLSPVCLQTENGIEQKVIGSYPKLTEKEALEALTAAANAYNNGKGEWPTMTVENRIKRVQEFTSLMKEKRTEVINLLMWEIGKSYQQSAKEFDRTIDYINDTIDALKNLDRKSSRFDIKEGIIAQIRRAPLGVVLCMGPFNYPLNETFTTLLPALIVGNTVIFKPPKYGALLHKPLLEAFQKAFPKGVVNTVYGQGAKIITPIIGNGKLDVLAFIGSSRVADILKKQHPNPHRLRCILGLDAKNAGIVLPDADLNLALKEIMLGSLSYNGQRCTALKILYVHRSIVDVFVQRLGEEIAKLKIGMPWDKDVEITPLPEADKTQWLTGFVKDAEQHGAKVVNEHGGTVNHTFFYPAIVYPVNSKMKLYSEEQFGPIIPVIPFDNIEEPMNYVIDSNFGQQVSIFGQDSDMIAKLIDPLVNQVCRVNINCQCQRGPDIFPFTGRKDSAEGTLSVSDALRVFSLRTLVATKDNELNKRIFKEILVDSKSNFLSTDFIF